MVRSVLVSALFLTLLFPAPARAHCDSVAGPVVQAAQSALESGDITPVLKWIQTKDEPEVRAAFQRARSVRQGGPEARALADQYFFETLVRVHRAGEGAPFTGLKSAEAAHDPVIEAVDRALVSGDGSELVEHTLAHLRGQVEQRFRETVTRRKTADQSVEAGRAYVAAYVELMQYVERLFAQAPPHAHAD